ncbi:MAG TPA: CD3324 family protein [Symbiobacteriaceae bacterium]|nr:CD3324 family protein [Symbiobacteriaceae bacterium]
MSSYVNAAKILPAHLLEALQRYAAGQQLYVPRPEERLGWGERSGTREALRARNDAICQRRAEGASVEELMAEFHLGYDSIRKILQRSREVAG